MDSIQGRRTRNSSEGSSRLTCSIPAALSALLFLAGGVATYFMPMLTPPLYIAGSAVTFAHSVALTRPGSKQDRGADGARLGSSIRTLAVAGVVVTAFWFGYLT